MDNQKRSEFFHSRPPVKKSSTLEQLMDAVLAESTKRSPKWKFRCAPDLIVELQPKARVIHAPGKARTKENLVSVTYFAGRMMQGEGVGIAAFLDGNVALNFRRIGFSIEIVDEWLLWVTNCGGYKIDDWDPRLALKARLVSVFDVGFFEQLQPEKMLGNYCLACGKGLTDPVSQARLIGPDCYGSSSENLRRIRNLIPEVKEVV